MRALLLLPAAFVTIPAALAQTPFVELALSDTSLTSPTNYVDSAAPADFDGDGDLDLLTVGSGGLVLRRNDGLAGGSTLNLVPVLVPTGDLILHGADLAWGDYDNDGDADLALGTVGREGDYLGEMALYRNDGGTLVRTPTALPGYVENGAFEMLDYRSLSWADPDNDGDLDLYVPASYGPDGECCDAAALLLRNDGPGAGDAWTFTATEPATSYGYDVVTAWGDRDQDGDLDLFLADFGRSLAFAQTYRNDGGAFVEVGPPLPHIWEGTADWGDADGDGDLDVLVAGLIYENGEFTSYDVRILLLDGASYDTLVVVSEADEPEWARFRAASWADYDSDGDVDVLLAGMAVMGTRFIGRARVYANDGAGAFTLVAQLPGPSEGQYGGTVQWFDVDGDGDLDYFITGAYGIPGPSGNEFEFRAQLFRNDAALQNAPPSAPSALSAEPVGADGVALSWGPSSDDHTPADALTYNLHVADLSGSDIVSPQAAPDGSGQRLLPEPGNVSHSTHWSLEGLEPGLYTWTVQAVDNAFNGGAFAAEGTFTVGTTTGTEEPGGAAALAMHGASPNPARSAATIRFDLPAPAEVGVRVFDVLGREVRALPARPVEAGANRALALDVRGLAPGTYVVRLDVRRGEAVEVRTARLVVAR